MKSKAKGQGPKRERPGNLNFSQRVTGFEDRKWYVVRWVEVWVIYGTGLLHQFVHEQGEVSLDIPYFTDKDGNDPRLQKLYEVLTGKVVEPNVSLNWDELEAKKCWAQAGRNAKDGAQFKIIDLAPLLDENTMPIPQQMPPSYITSSPVAPGTPTAQPVYPPPQWAPQGQQQPQVQADPYPLQIQPPPSMRK